MEMLFVTTTTFVLGVGGAFVAGSESLINFLTNFSKPYIYSTGLPPAMAYTIKHAVNMAEKQDWRRDKLQGLISLFKHSAQSYGIKLSDSMTAIQPIIIGDNLKTLQLAEKLKTLGFWTTAIRPPTVAVNTARLRITITVNHEEEDVINLINAIAKVMHA